MNLNILGFLRSRFQSFSFRLMLNYGLLSVFTTLILIGFIYVQFTNALRTEYFRQISLTAQRLSAVFYDGGQDALVGAINFTLSDHIDSEKEIYLLLDEHGKVLAGNIDEITKLKTKYNGIYDADIIVEGGPAQGFLKFQELPGNIVLVVGQDLSEIGDISSVVGKATAAAIFLAFLLVVIGSLIFKKELSYRLSNIRITTRQISAGHLSKRISTSVNDDEFIALNSDINMMLDRIELLMKSARHISDTIAHNIRTPLTRITGRLRMAQRADASQSDLLKANQDAIDGIENLNFLLEKILQIAELEGGIQRRTFKPCQLSVIVSDVLDMHEAFAEDKNIELIKNEMPDITIYGDVNLLASAIANLTSNAIKFASTTVTVDILKKEDTAEIIIQDDGPGVPAAELDNLGRHFYRLDPSQEGHGLGLTSAKSIIKLHRGSLSFFDAQPGLKVVISLPLG